MSGSNFYSASNKVVYVQKSIDCDILIMTVKQGISRFYSLLLSGFCEMRMQVVFLVFGLKI